jgi:glutathione synthase/RimK-type ligase-like ATP-grasp enzyme
MPDLCLQGRDAAAALLAQARSVMAAVSERRVAHAEDVAKLPAAGGKTAPMDLPKEVSTRAGRAVPTWMALPAPSQGATVVISGRIPAAQPA